MTKLYLKYNPYTVETEIEVDGMPVQAPSKLFDLKNERLQVWVENLIPILEEMCNDDEYHIDFYGTRLDYEDLQSCIQEYCDKHNDTKVEITYTEAKGSADRFSELVSLFKEMQTNCPFEDLKSEQIKENFESAISTEFEVSVIATMSSGKSTLINALLGHELMPSKNEACTATIAKIKDVDGMEHFTGEYRDQEKRLLGRYEHLTIDDMNEMNDNISTAFIDIQGDIPNIDSKDVQLVLVDTPGPNNSRTEEHKNHTYRVIKEKTKPMVLYVLNATQLQTNDDKELLTAVSDAMRVGGKQSKDRFLFAVNKIDLYDRDKESVEGAINNVKEYLKKFDIENPNIFPTSAELAKVIRMNRYGQQLTKAQRKTLRDYDFFIEEEQLHLSKQATLSKINMNKIEELLQEAKVSGNEYEEALIHTGIPAIELAIDEYLNKYAYTTKVKTAVDTFRKKVEEKDMHAKMMQSIQNNEEARKRVNAQLKSVKQQLEEGKSGEKFRHKIESLDMMKDADKRIVQLRTKITSTLVNKSQNNAMTTLEVQQLMMKLDRTIHNLQSDVKTELENIISDVIINNAQSIMKDYKQHMHELISNGELAAGNYNTESNIRFLETDVPDAQQIINAYRYSEKVDTGEQKWVENTSKKWYKPWTWFQESGHYKTIYKEVEMVDYGTVFNDFVQPVINNLNENLSNAKKVAKEEADRFKQYFLKELSQLEKIMKYKVEENEKLTRDQSTIESTIKADKEKVEWLEGFLKQLDEILTI